LNKFKSTYGILTAVKMYFVLKGLKENVILCADNNQ
jgi:hypothetical protein